MNKHRSGSDFQIRECLDTKVLCLFKEVVFYYLGCDEELVNVFKQVSYIIYILEKWQITI